MLKGCLQAKSNIMHEPFHIEGPSLLMAGISFLCFQRLSRLAGTFPRYSSALPLKRGEELSVQSADTAESRLMAENRHLKKEVADLKTQLQNLRIKVQLFTSGSLLCCRS